MFIAALPMYDWPEVRAETDALWERLALALRHEGFGAPERLARRNADLPSMPGGIRDRLGQLLAPDPATLPPDGLDLATLWRHPMLLFSQTCWGPMETGLEPHVHVLAQPDYTAYEGGEGGLYSSAIVMRRSEVPQPVPAPAARHAVVPIAALRGKRFVYNDPTSLSGFLGLKRDLKAAGKTLSLFSETVETGAHRASALAVAEGKADIAAIDCRSWSLLCQFEPASAELAVAGWTARRPGLPFITSRKTPSQHLATMRRVLMREIPMAS